MTPPVDIIGRRLAGQRLAGPAFRTAAEAVGWLGAVQSQDYPGARWALGMRTTGVTDTDVEREFDTGAILRTHVMRPTWHFVTPADIRWLLALTGPRVLARNGPTARKLGLDARTVSRGCAAMARVLAGGRHLTRAELAAALRRAGIDASGQRLAYLVMQAEADALICSGPRRGRQFTYALLEERAPAAPAVDRDTALAELVRRYFTSHGPATVRDFVWWSGLTTRDAKAGLAMLGSSIRTMEHNGLVYWFLPGRLPSRPPPPVAYLLPNYDEATNAYRDRDVLRMLPRPGSPTMSDGYPHLMLLDGMLVGAWRRVPAGRATRLDLRPFRRLTRAEASAFRTEGERYHCFLQQPVTLTGL